MKNKKGQALVEFIIILPVIIYVIMVIVDFLIIIDYKNNLESKMDGVVSLYKKGNVDEINDYLNKDLKNVTYTSKKDNKYTYIEVDIDYSFITPGLNNMLGDNFKIKSERVILNEQ